MSIASELYQLENELKVLTNVRDIKLLEKKLDIVSKIEAKRLVLQDKINKLEPAVKKEQDLMDHNNLIKDAEFEKDFAVKKEIFKDDLEKLATDLVKEDISKIATASVALDIIKLVLKSYSDKKSQTKLLDHIKRRPEEYDNIMLFVLRYYNLPVPEEYTKYIANK